MAGMIRGISVTLYERTQTGTDAFSAPVFRETCLPKGDTHRWDDCRVDFFGQSWRVYTPPREYIEAQLPLDWNRKVRVERYG